MIMRKLFLIVTICTICANAFAQIGPNLYYIEFTDKNNTPYSLDNPLEYLSQRAIDRRQAQNIAIDSLDLPVNPSYIAVLCTHRLHCDLFFMLQGSCNGRMD